MQSDIMRDRLIKAAYWLFILLAVYVTIQYLLALVLPFLVAAVIAELTRKPIDRLSRHKRIPRRIASFSVVTLALLAFLGLLLCVVYGLYAAAQAIIERLPQWLPLLEEGANRLKGIAQALPASLPDSLAAQIADAPAEIVQSILKKLTSFLAQTAGCLPAVLLTVGVSVIASYIVSADYHKLAHFLRDMLSPQTLHKLRTVRDVVLRKSRLLVRGYGILCLITFVELLIGLLLLGIPKAALIAAIVAAVDILPVFGTGTVLIPWAVFTLLQGNLPLGIGLAALYAVISVVRNFIEPHIIGAQIKLSPLIVLVCLFIGYRLFGIWGLLLSPFAASILKELVKQDVI